MGICGVCKEAKPRTSFDAQVSGHAKSHDRILVCYACGFRGFSPRDIVAYRCNHGCEGGHLMFPRTNFKNARTRGDALTCQACLDTSVVEERAESQREKDIKHKQKMKGAWKCKCGSQLGHSE